MNRMALSGAALAAALMIVSSAEAHVTLETSQAQAGTYYKAVLKVGHGCGGSPTTALKVTIPEGVLSVKPMAKPGWSVDTVSGAYEHAYSVHGQEVKEGVTSLTWSGGSLPNAQYDEFVFMAYLAPEAAGRSLPIPVVQTCAQGESRWVEVATSPGEKLASPAPVLRVAAAGGGAAMPGEVKAGSLVITAPWSRATPGGAKVAGGYLRITNTGTTPDKLIGGTFARSGSVQVHEMAMNNGVMSMRQLAGGLEIAPGQTVEFSPGGYHLMFMDLKQPLKEGETVSGTLVFEKAGTVDVSFAVQGIGAKGPASGPASGGAGHMDGMGGMHQH